jgi:serine/threonine protein kinase
VLEFLADCHKRSICYGDVKPNNFVLRSLYPSISHLMDPSKPRGNLEVVAVDFGCCQEVGEHCLPDTKVGGVTTCAGEGSSVAAAQYNKIWLFVATSGVHVGAVQFEAPNM